MNICHIVLDVLRTYIMQLNLNTTSTNVAYLALAPGGKSIYVYGLVVRVVQYSEYIVFSWSVF